MSHNLSVKQMIMALLAALLLIAVPMVAAAQDDNAQMQVLEFKGVVEAIDATTVTVSGLVFDISRAELDDDGPILVGAMVEVDFVVLEGAWVALEVYLERDDNDGFDAQLEGLLEAIGEGTITVNGLTIDTTQATFEDGLEVNTVVEVYYNIINGELVALRVESAEDDGSDDDNDNDRFEDYYFYGVLESLTATEAIVSGVMFDASRAILDDGVAVGVEVKIEYVIIEGVFVATEIETDSDDDSNGNDDDDDRFEDYYHYGVLESLTATEAIVSGVTFDASRAILDDGVAVGVEVKVEYLIIEGVFVATEIETDDDDDRDDDSNGNDDDDDSSKDDNGACVVEQPDDWTTYTVKAGDTLSAIALATDTDLDDLIEVNCIENPRAVAIGTILYVEDEADFSDINRGRDDDDDDDDDNDDRGRDDDDDDNGNDDDDDDDDDNGNDNDDDDDDDDDNDDDDDDEDGDDD